MKTNKICIYKHIIWCHQKNSERAGHRVWKFANYSSVKPQPTPSRGSRCLGRGSRTSRGEPDLAAGMGPNVGWVASFLHGCKIWLVGGWTNPSEKYYYVVKLEISYQNRGEHKTYLKPPPRNALQIICRLVITAPQTVAGIFFFSPGPGPHQLEVYNMGKLMYTPLKFNMEPEKKSLEKVIHFGSHHFQVPCWSSRV